MNIRRITRAARVLALLCLFSKAKAQCTISNIGTGSIVYTCPDAGIHCIGSTGAQGDAWIKYSPLNNGQLKKPFVFVEGLDLNVTAEATHRHGARGWPNFISGTTDENDLTEKVFEKAPILINELLARGYDVIYLDHSYGGAYMQDNARVFVDLIKKINLQKTGNEQIIVAGASMGGQTVKYGISLMEQENYKHCIADYISIDSPHQGANIPLGFQAMLKEYKFLDAELQAVYDGLSLPAARQLLLAHLEASSNNAPHADRAAWLSDLNAVGNYPKYCRKVAITSGNVNGMELFPESSKLLTLDLRTITNGCSRGLNLFDIDVYSQPGNAGHHVFYSRRPAGANFTDMWTNDQACGALCPVCLADPSVFYDFDYQTVNANAPRLDNCPGGKRNTAKQFVDRLNAAIANSSVSGFLNAITDIQYDQEFHGFIPTTSGLDVNTTNLFENVQSFIGTNTDPAPAKYPFDAYYGEAGDNKFHVEITGDVQNGNIRWLLDEATKIKTPIANPLTNAAPNSGVYNYARHENKLLSSLVIGNGGKLLVNASMPSDYGANTPSPYVTFMNLTPTPGSTYTLETCYCNNVVVTVDANGEFILGDNNGVNNNKAIVLFHEGSKLYVKNGGKLTIRKGSKLVMEENTLLSLEQGGQLIIEEGAWLVIKGTSQFTAAGFVTLNGGKIIQEPLSNLDLKGTGSLIVNNNSTVVVQTALVNPLASSNAVLSYEQGAIIELNGNNAVLELNGRLHIGDNAIFSIPYTGAPTGYIKFNRGNVWWDNSAPNNAHITCGVNAKVNLTGQSTTDKLIEINQMDVAMPKNLSRFDMTQCMVEFNVAKAMLETWAPGQMLACTFKGLPSLKGGFIPVSNFTRGLVCFGQAGFKVAGCDFISLGYGLTGTLFYNGNKLNVINSKFNDNYTGIFTVGAGSDVSTNQFTNNSVAVSCTDITLNTSISKNTISANISDMEYYGVPADPTGIDLLGSVGNAYVVQNNISKTGVAVFGTNANLHLKCNVMQNNSLAIFGNTNSNSYMSTLLNTGNNNAANCYQFAHFNDAKSWDPYQGYNSFKITDASPCSVRYVGTLHQLVTVCPAITKGTLVQTNSATNQNMAGHNFWITPSGTTNVVESEYNQLKKVSNNTGITVITNPPLPNQILVGCQEVSPTRAYLQSLVHPMEPEFASVTIHTGLFSGYTLQSALMESMAVKKDTNNINRLDVAANLLQEILEADYAGAVEEGDWYLLELAWQQLLETVSLLKEREINKDPLLVPLSTRFTKLLSIINKRIAMVKTGIDGYDKITAIMQLDRAFVYRLAEDRDAAIRQLYALSTNTALEKQYQNLCNHLMCMYRAEKDAMDNIITIEELLSRLMICREDYASQIATLSPGAERKNIHTEEAPLLSSPIAVSVYPNPVQDKLIIEYDLKQYQIISFEIEDVQGKKLASYSLNAEQTQFIIEHLNLENGMYIFRIKADNQAVLSQKLVIMR